MKIEGKGLYVLSKLSKYSLLSLSGKDSIPYTHKFPAERHHKRFQIVPRRSSPILTKLRGSRPEGSHHFGPADHEACDCREEGACDGQGPNMADGREERYCPTAKPFLAIRVQKGIGAERHHELF